MSGNDDLVACEHSKDPEHPSFCIACLRAAHVAVARDERKKVLDVFRKHVRDAAMANAIVAEVDKELPGAGKFLKSYDNGLVWSVERIESNNVFFFREVLGSLCHDGSRRDLLSTNLLRPGSLGAPVMFDADELRLYASSDERLQSLVADARLVEVMDFSNNYEHLFPSWFIPSRKRWSPERSLFKVEHRSLPMPERAENADQAQKLLEFVNGSQLSCITFTPHRRRIQSYDTICWRLETSRRDFNDESLLAVLVGDLWAPPEDES